MIKSLWEKYLAKGMPSYATGVLKIRYSDFEQIIDSRDLNKIEELIKLMSSGQILHLEECFSLDSTRKLKEATQDFWGSEPSSFHKMLEGCPNFHRVIDQEVAKNYSFSATKHSAYFFPWNPDPTGLSGLINSRWGKIKVLMGLKEDEYVKNTPKDGVVDRIQVVLYPPRHGALETHIDPFHNQLCFISGYLTTRGEGYKEGGFYAIDSMGEKLDLESQMREGDMGVGVATIQHGVSRIDPKYPSAEVDWNGKDGRWFLGLYSNDSDEVVKRKTGSAVR